MFKCCLLLSIEKCFKMLTNDVYKLHLEQAGKAGSSFKAETILCSDMPLDMAIILIGKKEVDDRPTHVSEKRILGEVSNAARVHETMQL